MKDFLQPIELLVEDASKEGNAVINVGDNQCLNCYEFSELVHCTSLSG